MALLRTSLFACLVAVASAGAHVGPCNKHTLDFILLEGDAMSLKIEDDIKADLAKIGITLNTRLLAKDDFNTAMTSGDFHLCFTETWGPPYEPHTQVSSWQVADEAHYAALTTSMKASLKTKVADVLKQENTAATQAKWTDILQDIHSYAISDSMWSNSMPAILNSRLSDYKPGYQQFDYPMHLINTAPGSSTTIKVAPGGQTGIFGGKNPLNEPHGYRPNEFFINNWIFEGLVAYDPTMPGGIAPSLATSWTSAKTNTGGMEYKFNLRPNVKFHDGTACDCAAVKMTFDHVLAPPLNTGDWHGWYNLVFALKSWECQGEVFVAKLDEPYYPLLQELCFIRPIRILSPSCYYGTGDPVADNSCPAGWDADIAQLTCKGAKCVAGTGPWKYTSKTVRGDDTVAEMRFSAHTDWWGSRGNVQEIVAMGHLTADDVKSDLLSGAIDMVVGGGVLAATTVKDIEVSNPNFVVMHGPPLNNKITVMNGNKAPTDDIQLRKVIMHAVNKAAIVDKELAGSAVVSDSLFPKDAPYCNIDLTPRWDYDFEKAQLLNCPPEPKEVEKIVEKEKIVTKLVTPAPGTVLRAKPSDDSTDNLAIGLGLGLGIPLFFSGAGAVLFYFKSRSANAALKEALTSKNGGANADATKIGGDEQI